VIPAGDFVAIEPAHGKGQQAVPAGHLQRRYLSVRAVMSLSQIVRAASSRLIS
jgi:hypothetical protein